MKDMQKLTTDNLEIDKRTVFVIECDVCSYVDRIGVTSQKAFLSIVNGNGWRSTSNEHCSHMVTCFECVENGKYKEI